jgi:cyclohexyl-isocyanide hydratase
MSDTNAQPIPPLQVGILLFPGYEPLDAIGPAQVFWTLASVRPYVPSFPEVEVHLVAATIEPVVAAYGFTVHPTTTFDACPALDVLIVPGGSGGGVDDDHFGRHYYWKHEATLDFVRRQDAGTTLTASVCTGAFILAGAGLLAGRRAATHWMAREELVARMVERDEPFELINERVVDDGDVVTAGGVSSGIALGFHLVERLFGREVRDAVYLGIEMETPAGSPV